VSTFAEHFRRTIFRFLGEPYSEISIENNVLRSIPSWILRSALRDTPTVPQLVPVIPSTTSPDNQPSFDHAGKFALRGMDWQSADFFVFCPGDPAVLPDVDQCSVLPFCSSGTLLLAYACLASCEDGAERVPLHLEIGFRQLLGAAVVEDPLDARAELLDVLDEEKGVGNELVPRFGLMRPAEILYRHALR